MDHYQYRATATSVISQRYPFGWIYPELTPALSSVRFDFIVAPHYLQKIVGVELKLSRADLQADLRSVKWKKYLPYCHELLFFVYHEVDLKNIEFPKEVGVIRIGPGLKSRQLQRSKARKVLPGYLAKTLAGICWRLQNASSNDLLSLGPKSMQGRVINAPKGG